MSVVRGGVGILGYGHPSRIPCSSFARGSLESDKCWVCFTELVWGREGVQCESLTSKEPLGSTSGAWLWVCAEQGKNVTMYLNHWLLWVISMFSFLHEVWKFSSSKKCVYLTTKGLTTLSQGGGSSSVAESQLTQGKSRGDWWKWEPLDTGGVWWLLTVGKQVTLHHLCESHLHFGRKLMEGKADTSGKSDLMEVMV